jgi:hypothetical protein
MTSMILGLFFVTYILCRLVDARDNGKIIDPWYVLYAGGGVLWTHHPLYCVSLLSHTLHACVLLSL